MLSRILFTKIKESLISVIPVVAIVLILYFTPLVSLSPTELIAFIVCAFLLILGIGLFNLGADLAMTPMGEHIGAGLSRSGNLAFLISVCFAMGLLITVAEPDLSVLATQVSAAIDGTVLIVSVGAGVGIFLVISVLKIVFGKPLSSLLLFFYMIMFAAASLVVINGNESFLALAFDSGGVTTGPITVPFIMALGVGIAVTLGGKHVGENSFGLIALCSVGPILAVMILGIGIKGDIPYSLPDYSVENQLGGQILKTLLAVTEEVALALGLIVLFFAVLQIFVLKLPKKKLIQIAIGIIYTFVGLVIFLSAVSIGFMPVGYKLGTELAKAPSAVLVIFGVILGAVVVLAEPAVHVLKKQVEDITERAVTARSMMIALSCGVGASIGLSMLRIIFDFNILFFIIPGYFISLGLSFFVPGIYTAIAFDSGGVASGPLTSSFILPLAIGACYTLQGEGKIMSDAFGVVAMVAMTPLITIQILGFRAILARKVKAKIALRAILASDDEQIIDFM